MIKILIAEDQRMLRGALGSLLDLEEDFEIIGQAENGEEALEKISSLKPDVCILDIEMPLLNGLDLAEELMKRNLTCKIIILTTFARPGYFERAVKLGVHGYLLKDGSVDDLADAIRQIMKGKYEFSPELVFNNIIEENPLSDREQEILRLVADGLTNKEISSKLFLSPGTVRNHMTTILNKLNAKNRVEAIAIASDKGFI